VATAKEIASCAGKFDKTLPACGQHDLRYTECGQHDLRYTECGQHDLRYTECGMNKYAITIRIRSPVYFSIHHLR
jgi:hypothetical protein